MRDAAICLVVLLGSWLTAVGQAVPQWKVVQVGSVIQSASIPLTTIFTPSGRGTYRLSASLSVKPGSHGDSVAIYFIWKDVSHQGGSAFFAADNNVFVASLTPVMFNPLAGSAVSYEVTSGVTGTGEYDLEFTIERLE